MGGAPPYKNNLIVTAAVGLSKLVLLKMNNKTLSTSLLFTCSLTDDSEAGRVNKETKTANRKRASPVTSRKRRRKPSEISRKHKETLEWKKDLRPA